MEIAVYLFGFGIALGAFVVWFSLPRRHSSELPSKEYREKHQAEYQDALDEIVRLDTNILGLRTDLANLRVQCAEQLEDIAELEKSVEHYKERLKTSEEIRQKLAASLSGRCCGDRITMGNTEAKIVHGSVVVSDPDARKERTTAERRSAHEHARSHHKEECVCDDCCFES